MKYLDSEGFSKLDLALQEGLPLRDEYVHGRVELYSCKMVNRDKKLLAFIEQRFGPEYAEEIEGIPGFSGSLDGVNTTPPAAARSSSGGAVSSSLGHMSDSSARKLLLNLILTMNQSFQDYDFTNLTPDNFVREESLAAVRHSVDTKLTDYGSDASTRFCIELWRTMEEEAGISDAQIYSYLPDDNDDCFSRGKLWSCNYFVYSARLKRIAFLSLWTPAQTPRMGALNASGSDLDDMSDDDGIMDMDL